MKAQNNKYLFPKKSELSTIDIKNITFELPDLKNTTESKASVIAKWMAAWIDTDLKSGKIKIHNIIPSKPEFAYLLGVSIGTMQNAIRILEDMGYVESKQCIGTLVTDHKKESHSLRKLTSKRELAVDAIKRYILSDGFKIGSPLPATRTIATIIGFSTNTTKLALDYLAAQNILLHRFTSSKVCSWTVLSLDFDVRTQNSHSAETLVDMVVKDLENYITNNLKPGDRLPAHGQLAKALKASIKTVHDSLKVLIDRGILLPRRGRYGTTVIKMPNSGELSGSKPETSIFASASDTAFYHYEKTQNHIKKMIAQDYQIGDRLPSISELAKRLDLSPNTIRKAFHNLAKEGYLVFSRGRYGGTFIIDIPEIDAQTFKWLAVNPQYAKNYHGVSSN